jgi:hypothetical protein
MADACHDYSHLSKKESKILESILNSTHVFVILGETKFAKHNNVFIISSFHAEKSSESLAIKIYIFLSV